MEGKIVGYRLTFGRFLRSGTSGSNVEIPTNLTGRRFRDYWRQTQDEKSEARRRSGSLVLTAYGRLTPGWEDWRTRRMAAGALVEPQALELSAGPLAKPKAHKRGESPPKWILLVTQW